MRLCALLLAASLLASAEDAVPPEVQSRVSTYLSTRDAAEAEKLEAALKDVPFATLAQAVRLSTWGEEKPAATGEFEVTNPDGGTKSKVLYQLPASYSRDRAWPLLVAMHGNKGHAAQERTRWAAQPKAADFILVCTQEEAKFAGKGWGSSEEERRLELAAIDEAMQRFRVDPDRVFLAGITRGGHAAWEIGLLYADRFAGLYSDAGGLRLVGFGYMHNLGAVPMLESIGDKDQPLLLTDLSEVGEALKKDGSEVAFRQHGGAARDYAGADDAEFAGWVAEKKRDAFPRHFVHAFSKPSQGRAYWVQATRVDIEALDPLKEKPKVPIPAGKKPTAEEMRAMYVKKVMDGVARIEASVDGQKIDVMARYAAEVQVFFSDRLVDLGKPVTVTINGKQRFEGKVEPDAIKMLQHVRQTHDRGRVFASWMKFPLN